MERSTLRFPLSECVSGSRSSSRRTPTTIGAASGPLHGPLRPLGAARGRRREASGDLLDLVRLDHVPDLQVLIVLEARAALVARRHLAHVLLEAAEAADLAVVHDDVVAE